MRIAFCTFLCTRVHLCSSDSRILSHYDATLAGKFSYLGGIVFGSDRTGALGRLHFGQVLC